MGAIMLNIAVECIPMMTVSLSSVLLVTRRHAGFLSSQFSWGPPAHPGRGFVLRCVCVWGRVCLSRGFGFLGRSRPLLVVVGLSLVVLFVFLFVLNEASTF